MIYSYYKECKKKKEIWKKKVHQVLKEIIKTLEPNDKQNDCFSFIISTQ